MVTLPPEWEAYARLQDKVDRSSKIDQRIEALEAVMNRMLDDGAGLDEPAIVTAAESAARKERHRAHLRQRYLPLEEPTTDLVTDVEVRSLYARVKKVIPPSDWSIMASAAAGHSHCEIATLAACSESAVGVRIFRARRNAKTALSAGLLAELHELLAA